MERIVNFVISKAPSDKEFKEFLAKRHTTESTLKRVELDCIVYDGKADRWHYVPELDAYKMA